MWSRAWYRLSETTMTPAREGKARGKAEQLHCAEFSPRHIRQTGKASNWFSDSSASNVANHPAYGSHATERSPVSSSYLHCSRSGRGQHEAQVGRAIPCRLKVPWGRSPANLHSAERSADLLTAVANDLQVGLNISEISSHNTSP
jgi:hypothetical protein